MTGNSATAGGCGRTSSPDRGNNSGEKSEQRPPFYARLLPYELRTGPVSLEEHDARFGPLAHIGTGIEQRAAFLANIGRSGLVGRGGAGFPAAQKLAALDGSQRPVVIANGTEGEPDSQKDKVLLSLSPHLVLDGAVLVAEVTGAREAYVVVHPSVVGSVAAEAERRLSLRHDVVRLRVLPGVDRYVAGEASALANYLETGTAKPRRNPPRLVERGAWGRPTLVNNVETLAHIALIARYGSVWFRSVGTPDEPGSMLVTLLGGVKRPAVIEVEMGTPVKDLLLAAGGPSGRLQAVLFGGYFGSFLRADDALSRPYSRAGLATLGADVGAGVVFAVDDRTCGLSETSRITSYLASQSAGQCGPCVFGLAAIAHELDALAAGRLSHGTARLERWARQVQGRGGCHLPDGAYRLVRSALRTFSEDVAAHLNGHCLARSRRVPRSAPLEAA